MSSGKLSQAELEKIIKCYAYWLSAEQALSGKYDYASPASRNTTYRIFGLIRKRLTETGYYVGSEEKAASDLTEDLNRQAYNNMLQRIRQRRAATPGTRAHHWAEIAFRVLNPEVNRDRHYREIIKVIKLSGPLNKPLPADFDMSAYMTLLECDREIVRVKGGIKAYRKHARTLRARTPNATEQIVYFEDLAEVLEEVALPTLREKQIDAAKEWERVRRRKK